MEASDMEYPNLRVALFLVASLCIPACLHADCTGVVCQGAHSPSAESQAPDGNCCKDGVLEETPGGVNQQGCDGYRNYWWQNKTEKLKDITHSGQCVDTQGEPCIPCGVAEEEQGECPDLLTEAIWRSHQLWQMGYGYVYTHHWRTDQVTTDCNCGRHGC